MFISGSVSSHTLVEQRSALKADDSQKGDKDTQGETKAQARMILVIAFIHEINHYHQIRLHTNEILCRDDDKCNVSWTRFLEA